MALQAKRSTSRSSEAKQAALEEATKEDVTRLNAMIPKSLHKRLKMQAIEEGDGSTVTAIIVRAAEEYLERYGDT